MSFTEEFYSRQTAAIGTNAMKKLTKLKILIYGLGGLGVEISKNIILSGPEKVTIYDKKKVKLEDLASNFYLNEKDIGFRRDEKCISKLKELNNIECDILEDDNFNEHIIKYDIVIITEILDLDRLKEINNICHKNKIGFIYGLSLGLSFFCFVDFGEHSICNKNNKEPERYYIKNIIKSEKTKIIIDNSNKENFKLNPNDYVVFKEIVGFSQLNNGVKRKIISATNDYFELDENSLDYDNYIEGGIVEEVKEITIFHNKSLEFLMEQPFSCEDTLDEEENLNMHLAFILIHEYFKIKKKFPENEEDINYFSEIKSNIFKKYKNENYILNEEYIDKIIKFSKYEISPICGYGGGIIAQEILKYTGIYMPINQWFRYSFYDMLDESIIYKKTLNNTRYKGQIQIFGEETQKKIEKLNLFIIGAGAVGCELLKNFAMMGISTDENSLLTITDHDLIEKSNLNRQFLFKEKDIINNKSKAECAINSIKEMNPKINCKYYVEFVCKNTENIFNEEFFKKQDVVVLAVDNFEARNYISNKCEEYKIPYLNCGTEGTYANLGAYIPGMTKQATFPKQNNVEIPPCTLKFFPSKIIHCISWANNHFIKFFNEDIKYIKSMHYHFKDFYDDLIKKDLELEIVYKKLKKYFKLFKIANEKNFDKCIKFGIKKYVKLFNTNINFILECYPPNKISKITGKKFWSGSKRLPHPLILDINSELCFQFIKSFSCLLSNALDIDVSNYNINNYIIEYCKGFKMKEIKKKELKDKSFYQEKINEIHENILNYFSKEKVNKQINYKILNYEKDSKDPNQLDFIFSSSILRAENFNIEKIDKFKIKIIAGNIIPSLITTTSSIAGLLALQIYVLCQNKNCEKFRVGMIDLADNTINLAIPSLLED